MLNASERVSEVLSNTENRAIRDQIFVLIFEKIIPFEDFAPMVGFLAVSLLRRPLSTYFQ
jgi:hypothetical protein